MQSVPAEVTTREFTPGGIRAAIGAWGGFITGPNVMMSSIASLYIVPWTGDFHISRTFASAILLIPPLTIALTVPFAGRLLDRFGLRPVLIPAMILFALLNCAMALPQSAWQLAAIFFCVSLAASAQSSVGYVKLISMWFARQRGLVLGLVVALGSAAGSIAVLQIVRRLIDHFGWRLSYVGVGAMILVLGIPLLGLCAHEPGGAHNSRHSGASNPNQPGLTRAEALKTARFWILFGAIFCASMAIIGTNAHAIPILTERHFARGLATNAFSTVFVGGMIGQLSSGFVADRFNSPRVVLPYFAAAAVGVFAIHNVTTVPLLFGGALLMGLGQGAEIALAGYLTSRYFGLKQFGSIYALYFGASNLGICAGILTLGRIHDSAGSYAPARLLFAGIMVVSLVLMALLGKYTYASRPADTERADISADELLVDQ